MAHRVGARKPARATSVSPARAAYLRFAAALALGALSVLGFAPFELFPIPLVTVAALIVLWRRTASVRGCVAAGFAFGLGYFLAGVSWVYVSLSEFGGMPGWLAGIATLLFCAYLALFPALAGYFFARFRSGSWPFDTVLAAASWTLAEWLRGWLFSGFPWLAVGYAQTPPSPLAGFAPVLGVYGVGFVSVVVSALLAASWRGQERNLWAGAAVLVIAAAGWAGMRHVWSQPVGQPLTVSLLQGNIEQGMKWKPERLTNSLDAYLRLARAHPAQLVVLPETAIPLLLDQIPDDYRRELEKTAAGGNVLLGSVARDAAGDYYNGAFTLGADAGQNYRKQHLVPFGEFTPPAFQWTLALLRIPMSDFSRGPANQLPLAVSGQRVAVNICYEDVFGEEIIRSLPDATLLVNLSNTAWFGDSLAQPQHLQIARMRAIETARPVLSATNTGMTAIIGANGEVSGVLPPFVEDALTGTVIGRSGATPYVRWGNLPAVIVSLALLTWGAIGMRRRQHRASNAAR